MRLLDKLNLIDDVVVNYLQRNKFGIDSDEEVERIAREGLQEVINKLNHNYYINDLQIELTRCGLSYKLRCKNLLEINNTNSSVLNEIDKLYNKVYINSDLGDNQYIATLFLYDQGNGVCTVIVP